MRLLDKYGFLSVAQIRASAYDGQVAYLPKENGSGGLSVLTAQDVAAWLPLHDATPPLLLVVNYEDRNADWMLGGWAIGVQKGLWIQSQLAALSIQNDPVVYLSADFHPVGAGQLQAILDCIRGAQSVLGSRARGVYGFVEVLDAVRAAGLADYFWLCGDHVGLQNRPWINLYQHNNDQDIVDGVTVDINDVLTPASFGQWVPGAPSAGGEDVFDNAAQQYLDTMRNALAQWVTDRVNEARHYPFEAVRNSDTGEVVLAAPGHWLHVLSVPYLQLYQARKICGPTLPERNVPTNEFDHLRDFLFIPGGTGLDTTKLAEDIAKQLPALDAATVAAHVAGQTAAANEAAFAKVLAGVTINLSGTATGPAPITGGTPA
jgi:hypothetical protein